MAYDPKKFTEDLKSAYGRRLKSVILYGSAVTGDRHKRWSDYNVLVVLDKTDYGTLRKASVPVRRWTAAGNRPPVTMTPRFLKRSADVFPIEWLDMRDARKVLYGTDLLKNLKVSPANLRSELEREMKSAQLRLLREIQTIGWFRRRARLRELLIRSNSTFQVLFRGVLRLLKVRPLPPKRDAADALAGRLRFDPAPFDYAERLKAGDRITRRADPAGWAGRYLRSLDALINKVDAWNR
jgi:predicted nucleotidyltransferase